MTTLLEPPPPAAKPVRRTAADVVEALGVPADRVLVNPAPGMATEADCARCERPTELINATLVEKPVYNYFERRWIPNRVPHSGVCDRSVRCSNFDGRWVVPHVGW